MGVESVIKLGFCCVYKETNGLVVVFYGDKRNNSSSSNYHDQYICSVIFNYKDFYFGNSPKESATWSFLEFEV